MIKYLGKKTIYDRLRVICRDIGIELPKMKECDYNFYRGDEMLRFVNYTEINYYLCSVEEVEVRVFTPKNEESGRPVMHIWIEKSVENNVEILQETTRKYTYYNLERRYSLIKNNGKTEEWVKGIDEAEE